jgi:hypothetical protein
MINNISMGLVGAGIIIFCCYMTGQILGRFLIIKEKENCCNRKR